MIGYDLRTIGKAFLTVGAILSFPAPPLGVALCLTGLVLWAAGIRAGGPPELR